MTPPRLSPALVGAAFALPLALALVAACDDPDPEAARTLAVDPPADAPEGPPLGLAAADPGPQAAIDCTESTDTGYVKGNPFPITVVTVDGKPVEKSTANAYYVMQQAAAKDGVNIKIVSGFRTQAEQQYLYNCYINCNCNNCNLAAKPGYSNHQSGHALDLNTSSAGVYSWLAAHGAAYGFKETVQGEPWHWEWWGGGPAGGPCGSCEAHCEGSKIIGEDCGVGDCGVYGANCVDDNLGPRCVFFACPPKGTAKVCVDDKIIGDCKDGQISTGDCSAFAAYCSTELGDQARCVSIFCAAPGETPLAHDGCFLDGNPYHCDELGQISSEPCPAGQACTVYPEVHCEAGLGCPKSGDGSVCLGDTAIGTCHEGAVIEAVDCGDFAGYCSTAGGAEPHCVASFCVDSPDEVPSEHAICLPDHNLGLCLADGSLKTSECPMGTVCVEGEFGAACVADDGGSESGSGSDGSSSGGGSSSGSGSGSGTGADAGSASEGSSGDAGSASASASVSAGATATATGGDDDAGGCACGVAGAGRRGLGGLFFGVLGGIVLRRRRAGPVLRRG